MVKCKICGIENDPNESGYCKNCLAALTFDQSDSSVEKHDDSVEPSIKSENLEKAVSIKIEPNNESLPQEHESSPALNKSGGSANPNTDENDSCPDTSDNFDDESLIEIKEVSFDDSSVGLVSSGSEEDDTSIIKEGTHQSGSDDNDTDDVELEKDLTLYRDDRLQITMEHTEDGPEISLTNKSDFEGLAMQPTYESDENISDEDVPPMLTEEELGFDSMEEKSITQKIIINPDIEKKSKDTKPKKTEGLTYSSTRSPSIRKFGAETEFAAPDLDISDKKQKTKKPSISPESIEISQLAKSHGIAYVSGNSIKFPGGFKPQPGEKVTVGEKLFQLKEKQSNKMPLYAGIGGAIIIVFILLGVLLNPSSTGKGQIVGTLSYPDNGGPVKGAIVTIKELNKSTETSYAGFFVFDQIPAEIYTIVVKDEGVGILSERMPVLNNKTSTLSFSLPSDEETMPESSLNNGISKSKDMPASKTSGYGFMKLKLTPSKSKVYLDDKYIGKGSQTFKVSEGRHKVTVKYSGYKNSTKRVNIPNDQIKLYTFKLKKNQSASKKQKKKSNEELATELEEQGKYSEAITYYDKVLAKNENNIEALTGKARCYKARGESRQALSLYLKAAQAAKTQDDIPSRLGALTGVLEINPNYLTSRYSRGLIYLNQGEYYRAAQDFSKVIEIDKRHLNAYYKLGEAYYKSKNYPAALDAYQGIQKLNFADAKPYAYMAKIYLKLDDKKNMKKSYEKFDKTADMSTKIKFDSDPEWMQVKKKLGK